MHESLVLMTWIRATLTSDATLASLVGTRVYEGVVPQGATYPLVLFALLTETDVRGISASRLGTSQDFIIRAVDKATSFTTLQAIAERIEALLHGGSGAVSPSGRVVACVRLGPAQMVEVDEGVTYRYLGGRYRGLTQAT